MNPELFSHLLSSFFPKSVKKEKYPNEYVAEGWDKELEGIYLNLSNKWQYNPQGYCEEASIEVYKKLGFEIGCGYFIPDFPFMIGQDTSHFWSIDPKNRVVDLTGIQFNSYLWPWNRLPSGVLVMNPNSARAQRYLRADHLMRT